MRRDQNKVESLTVFSYWYPKSPINFGIWIYPAGYKLRKLKELIDNSTIFYQEYTKMEKDPSYDPKSKVRWSLQSFNSTYTTETYGIH